ncbi:PKD-like family lipoprotein [Chitinophaga sp. XS-30]|uniref:PKD-like family lipoprotein n=1 Tax=Chitinophaga sp. XS-30 TaxID=2604421 RepID=UPI0011DD909D|nr:PKD-like family lipoprotein [Chitinophaga sp. XS-30]QEH42460.1 DUF1439 domain-containing protein [Chitinophaga sp. XS-30]
MLRHIFLCIGFVMLFTACQKDKQDYRFEKQNTVSVKTADSIFTVTQFETLKVETILTESVPSQDSYSYQWKAWQVGGDTVILSRDKDLDINIILQPGRYELEYKVTNNRTGIASFMIYRLTVNGGFYEGWLVSNSKNGKAQLSFIREDGELFLNPAELINNTTYPGKALGAFAAIDPYGSMALINFFTDQGVYRFNANDLVQNGITTDIFPEGKQFSSLPCYAISKAAIDQYIIADGGLHAGLGPLFFPAEVLKPFSDRFPGDYTLFPAIITSSQTATLFYDNKHKRFMQASYLDRELTVASGSDAAAFNMGNVGMTMLASDYGVRGAYSDEYYFVMQGADGRYILSLSSTTPGMNQKIGNSPDIEQATSFTTSSVAKHLYYAANNKIYLYDMLANSSRPVFSFPASVQIADMKLLRSTSKRLVVATTDGQEGKVHYFDLDNLGDVTGNAATNIFTGFGEIAHLSYRD